MSETLFEKGGLQIVRCAARCDVCNAVKRGTQRHSETGFVTVCDECERDCKVAIRGPSPLTENPRSESGESISSRQVSEWLEHLCGILDGEMAKLEALGVSTFGENFNWLGDCRRTAQWLWDGKFEIRDPWRLRMAVNELLKAWDRDGFRTTPARTRELMSMLFQAFEPFKGSL